MFSKMMAAMLTVAGLAFAAQGPRVVTIQGNVTAVNITYGSQYPSIQINQTTIQIAPVWFLLENNFEIKVGDNLSVTAIPSLQRGSSYLVATSLENTATSASIVLRETTGQPLWTQRNPPRQATCAACVGITEIGTVSGTVDQITAGIGIQMPSLVLKTNDGKLLTVKIGPERVLQTADFEINAGDRLTVRYGVDRLGDTLALELENAAGVKLVLRNDDGTPAW